jgi:hypothetical protein
MNVFGKLFLSFGVFAVVSVNAAPSTIDFVGLTPGITTAEDLKPISEGRRYEISGFRLSCDPEFDGEKLASFTCFTGLPHYSYDLNSKDQSRQVTNNEIHEIFLKGFTKKFGPPVKFEKSNVKNAFGVNFQQHIAIWKDDAGNVLTISNMNGKIDAGVIMLESQSSHQKRNSKDVLANRKF